jgi:hypothetical protein
VNAVHVQVHLPIFKKELIIESGSIKGSVEVGPDDTPADVRVLLHEEFDDDMLLPMCAMMKNAAGCCECYRCIDDFTLRR